MTIPKIGFHSTSYDVPRSPAAPIILTFEGEDIGKELKVFPLSDPTVNSTLAALQLFDIETGKLKPVVIKIKEVVDSLSPLGISEKEVLDALQSGSLESLHSKFKHTDFFEKQLLRLAPHLKREDVLKTVTYINTNWQTLATQAYQKRESHYLRPTDSNPLTLECTTGGAIVIHLCHTNRKGKLTSDDPHIDKELGSGTNKRVTRAANLSLGRLEASGSMQARKLSQDEIEMMKQFSGFPHFVQLYRLFQYPGKPGEEDKVRIVTQLCTGDMGSLEIPKRYLGGFMEEIALALSKVHRMGVIHCDIKFQNLFVYDGADGRSHIAIGDFGLTTTAEKLANSSHPNVMRGTPYFFATEYAKAICERKPLPPVTTPALDCWALGVTLYQLLSFIESNSLPPLPWDSAFKKMVDLQRHKPGVDPNIPNTPANWQEYRKQWNAITLEGLQVIAALRDDFLGATPPAIGTPEALVWGLLQPNTAQRLTMAHAIPLIRNTDWN